MVFTSQTTVSDVRSSAMIFQLGPTIGQKLQAQGFVVLIARFNTEVYAWSNSIPASLINLPASIACCVPFSDKSTSAQPVKRLALFHSDSPWRAKPILLPLDGSPFLFSEVSPFIYFLFY